MTTTESKPTVDECYYCGKPLGREPDGMISACLDVDCAGNRIGVGPEYAPPGTVRE